MRHHVSSQLLRAGALLLAALLSAGCTTLRPVLPPTPEAARAQVQVGDEIELTLTDGRELQMQVTGINAQFLTGSNGQANYTAYWPQVLAIKERRVSLGRTLGAGVVSGVTLFYVAVTVALLAWAGTF